MMAVQQTYMGPLPPPEDLARYDEIVPGMAERLLTGFERQTEHRMALEKKVIDRDIRRADWGLGAGFAFGLVVFAGALGLILTGHESVGVGTIIADFLTYGGAFLYGDIQRRRERNRKAGGR